MRIRTIKPEFWRSDDVVSLPISARLTFIALWSYVDDNGTGDGRLSSIISDLYSIDFFNNPRETLARLTEDLKHLQEKEMIAFFGTEKPYIAITGWKLHQKIDKPSKGHLYPTWKPDLPALTVDQAQELASVSRVSRSNYAPVTGEQGNRGTGELSFAQTSASEGIAQPSKPTGYTQEFETFWETYPLKRDKRKAFKAFQQARKRASLDEITAGAKRYRDDPNRVEQFTKYAEGWLRADGWLDAPLPEKNSNPSPSQTAISWIEMGQQLNENPTNPGRLTA